MLNASKSQSIASHRTEQCLPELWGNTGWLVPCPEGGLEVYRMEYEGIRYVSIWVEVPGDNWGS